MSGVGLCYGGGGGGVGKRLSDLGTKLCNLHVIVWCCNMGGFRGIL